MSEPLPHQPGALPSALLPTAGGVFNGSSSASAVPAVSSGVSGSYGGYEHMALQQQQQPPLSAAEAALRAAAAVNAKFGVASAPAGMQLLCIYIYIRVHKQYASCQGVVVDIPLYSSCGMCVLVFRPCSVGSQYRAFRHAVATATCQLCMYAVSWHSFADRSHRSSVLVLSVPLLRTSITTNTEYNYYHCCYHYYCFLYNNSGRSCACCWWTYRSSSSSGSSSSKS
jgi:hypothetical protein